MTLNSIRRRASRRGQAATRTRDNTKERSPSLVPLSSPDLFRRIYENRTAAQIVTAQILAASRTANAAQPCTPITSRAAITPPLSRPSPPFPHFHENGVQWRLRWDVETPRRPRPAFYQGRHLRSSNRVGTVLLSAVICLVPGNKILFKPQKATGCCVGRAPSDRVNGNISRKQKIQQKIYIKKKRLLAHFHLLTRIMPPRYIHYRP